MTTKSNYKHPLDLCQEVVEAISNKYGIKTCDITVHWINPKTIGWSCSEDWDGYIHLREETPEELGIEVNEEVEHIYFPYDITGGAGYQSNRFYATKVKVGQIIMSEGTMIIKGGEPLPEGHVYTMRPYEDRERIA